MDPPICLVSYLISWEWPLTEVAIVYDVTLALTGAFVFGPHWCHGFVYLALIGALRILRCNDVALFLCCVPPRLVFKRSLTISLVLLPFLLCLVTRVWSTLDFCCARFWSDWVYLCVDREVVGWGTFQHTIAAGAKMRRS